MGAVSDVIRAFPISLTIILAAADSVNALVTTSLRSRCQQFRHLVRKTRAPAIVPVTRSTGPAAQSKQIGGRCNGTQSSLSGGHS